MYVGSLTKAQIVEAFQVMIDQGWRKAEIDKLWLEAVELNRREDSSNEERC